MRITQHSDNFDIFVQVKIFLCDTNVLRFFPRSSPNLPEHLTPLPKLYMQTSRVEFRCFHYFVEVVSFVQKQNFQKYNDEIALGIN